MLTGVCWLKHLEKLENFLGYKDRSSLRGIFLLRSSRSFSFIELLTKEPFSGPSWQALGLFRFVEPSNRVTPCIARSLQSVALRSRRGLRLPLSPSSWSSIPPRLGSLQRLAFQNEPRTPVQHPTPPVYSPRCSSCHGSRAGRDVSGRSRPR